MRILTANLMGKFFQWVAEPLCFVLGRIVDLVGPAQGNHPDQTHIVGDDDCMAAVLAASLGRLRATHNLCWL